MLAYLNSLYPVRFTALGLCVFGALLSLFALVGFGAGGLAFVVFTGLSVLGWYDLRQTKRAVLRNYPVIGHLRFMLEFIRPEIRQYFIESDTEAAPFSRPQRSLVYQRAKGEPDKRPFGTQLDVGAEGYEWINHSMAPTQHRLARLPRDHRRGHGASPTSASVFNISAMSFGALSANAILALNEGAQRGGFAHDTGEGSISGAPPRARRRPDLGDRLGLLRLPQRRRHLQRREVRGQRARPAGEDDRAQAQPGRQARPRRRAARARRSRPRSPRRAACRVGVDCVSPASAQRVFARPIEMMQFIDRLRELSGGKPTGFKLCIGHPWEWFAHRQGHAGNRHHARLHRRRRRRGRHRRGAAGIHRPRGRAAAGRAAAGAQHAGRRRTCATRIASAAPARWSAPSTSRA